MEDFEHILRYKKEIEEAYSKILAPYAAKVPRADSRRYDEIENDDENRSSFQRDRDRIIHSSAFRRMMYKTQVFVNHEGDHFRTRLTHSLEVAQLARGIAKSLGLNEDLAEAIALGHDLGHTPFGHAAEEVFNERLKDVGLAGFYHNEQSVRVVDELETRYNDSYNGLNLTAEVREGILKHNNDRTGLYEELKPYEACSTLEGQIVRLTDTIAYTCHDLDDGIKSRILSKNCSKNPDIDAEYNKLRERILDETGIEMTNRADGNLSFVGKLLHYFINKLTLSGYESLCEFNIKSREDVEEIASRRMLVIKQDDRTLELFRELKNFVGLGVYKTATVQMMDMKAQTVVEQMFDAFYENTLLLPPEWKFKVENFNKLPEYKGVLGADAAKARVICDYISCMTDRYALEEYERLFDPKVRI